MKETLIPGLGHKSSHLVTKAMAPGHLSIVVLSTPDMIRLIEFTCHDGVLSHLDDGETTVGTHVCVSHSGAAYEDEEVSVTTRLVKVERRRLTFEVEVHSPRGEISAGTHERAVLDTSRFSAGR